MPRRRRNPSLGDIDTLLMLVAAGGAVWIAYKVFGLGKGAAAAVSSAQQSAGSKVADWLESIFPHAVSTAAFAPGSTIILPDGTEITSDLVSGVGQFTALDGSQQFQFYFGGQAYRTAARPDETNTYYALPAGAAAATITAATASTSALSVSDQLNMLAQSG